VAWALSRECPNVEREKGLAKEQRMIGGGGEEKGKHCCNKKEREGTSQRVVNRNGTKEKATSSLRSKGNGETRDQEKGRINPAHTRLGGKKKIEEKCR